MNDYLRATGKPNSSISIEDYLTFRNVATREMQAGLVSSSSAIMNSHIREEKVSYVEESDNPFSGLKVNEKKVVDFQEVVKNDSSTESRSLHTEETPQTNSRLALLKRIKG